MFSSPNMFSLSMFTPSPSRIVLLAALTLSLCGCSNENSARLDYAMGERVPLGPLTYTVVETAWRTQLGEGFKVRSPERRFLLITLSVTNGGGSDVSIPLLDLEGPDGQTYKELSNGDGVENWFGLLRTVSPAQTQQGRILFDVGLTSYKLRLSSGDLASEKAAWVQIPLRMDTDTQVQSPTPGSTPGSGIK
jgi:hypothetical protein